MKCVCGGCGRQFTSDSAFDAHRIGPFTDRACLAVESADGWRLTARGWTNAAPLPSGAFGATS